MKAFVFQPVFCLLYQGALLNTLGPSVAFAVYTAAMLISLKPLNKVTVRSWCKLSQVKHAFWQQIEFILIQPTVVLLLFCFFAMRWLFRFKLVVCLASFVQQVKLWPDSLIKSGVTCYSDYVAFKKPQSGVSLTPMVIS